jgi:hypothetical protein
MNYELEYKLGSDRESYSTDGMATGVRILVALNRELNENDKRMLHKKGQEIEEELIAESIKLNPESIKKKIQEKENIIKLFPNLIFVEEIPNEYCNRYCCREKPWFRVTTKIGHIKIGWRKSVINIDWSNTIVKSFGKDLFPNENTTVGDYNIHAWGYENAKRYIDLLLDAKTQEG